MEDGPSGGGVDANGGGPLVGGQAVGQDAITWVDSHVGAGGLVGEEVVPGDGLGAFPTPPDHFLDFSRKSGKVAEFREEGHSERQPVLGFD